MTIDNTPSPRPWRNRVQRAPRRNWVVLALVLLGLLSCVIFSSVLGLAAQAETGNAQNAASWWQFWNRAEVDSDPANSTTIDFTPSQDVLTQLNKLGYESIEEFATAWGLKIGTDMANGETDPREITVCPFETQGCIRILREKNEDAVVEWAFFAKNPDTCWHDGYRRLAGEMRPGGYQIPERTGVPPQFEGLLEGVTIRKCQETGTSGTLPGAAEVSSNRTPTDAGSAPQGTGGTSTSSWSEATARSEFKLDASVQLRAEGSCYAASHSSGKFSITNTRDTWVDGYRDQVSDPPVLRPGADDPKLSIPPNWSGFVGGATLCPAQ